MTEPGSKGLRIAKFNDENGGVHCWEAFLAGVELLEDSNDFETVVIDTIDNLYQMCFDYVCSSRGVEHPSEINGGKGDYGATWKAISMEFARAIRRISRTNRGVCFTSHVQYKEMETSNGTKYTMIQPTLTGGAGDMIRGLVDFIFFADHCQRIKGVWSDDEDPAILICRGNEQLIAGSRPSPNMPIFPRYLPMNIKGTYQKIKAAFDGKYDGLDPLRVVAAKTAKQGVKDFMGKVRTQSATIKTDE